MFNNNVLETLSVVSGILLFMGFIPYIKAIIKKKKKLNRQKQLGLFGQS
ncbi:hypothetical protein ACFL1Y_00775 [Patescibacteria group bacterium]